MKLNLGCGHRKLPGFVNVDAAPECEPDEVFDLDQTPWPWPDDCADEVRFIHSLEHLGADTPTFLRIMEELYRVAAPGCRIQIHVPHPRHDNFLHDPTHVRIVSPETLKLFDHALNDEFKAKGGATSTLAHYLHVDFWLEHAETVLAEPFAGQHLRGEIDDPEAMRLLSLHNNVAIEYRMILRAQKPLGARPPPVQK